jgi:hypothetical protein
MFYSLHGPVLYGLAIHAVESFRVPQAYQSQLNVISLLHPGPGPDCPLTRMRGLELMSTRAFHLAHGQTVGIARKHAALHTSSWSTFRPWHPCRQSAGEPAIVARSVAAAYGNGAKLVAVTAAGRGHMVTAELQQQQLAKPG